MVVKIPGGPVFVLEAHLFGFFTSEILDAGIGLKVILNEESFSVLVNPLESM